MIFDVISLPLLPHSLLDPSAPAHSERHSGIGEPSEPSSSFFRIELELVVLKLI